MEVIDNLLKRKNLPELQNNYQRTVRISNVFYRNLDIKEMMVTGYPTKTEDFISLENINRPISAFIDLSNPSDHEATKMRIPQIYYLENQIRITPNSELPLIESLS